MLLGDKKSCVAELYQIFSQYPESLLSHVLNFMKDGRIITKIKRVCCLITETNESECSVSSQSLAAVPRPAPSTIGTYHPSQKYHHESEV
jgi:hypothetical protein